MKEPKASKKLGAPLRKRRLSNRSIIRKTTPQIRLLIAADHVLILEG